MNEILLGILPGLSTMMTMMMMIVVVKVVVVISFRKVQCLKFVEEKG